LPVIVIFPETVNVATLAPQGIVLVVFVQGLADKLNPEGALKTTIPEPPAAPPSIKEHGGPPGVS
jgi:hypothetical protein